MNVEQITRERKRAGCVGCGTIVMHVQIADFTASGHKFYQWIPIGHRRADGTSCTHLAETRDSVWKTKTK